jgi:hypothetical protein
LDIQKVWPSGNSCPFFVTINENGPSALDGPFSFFRVCRSFDANQSTAEQSRNINKTNPQEFDHMDLPWLSFFMSQEMTEKITSICYKYFIINLDNMKRRGFTNRCLNAKEP